MVEVCTKQGWRMRRMLWVPWRESDKEDVMYA